MIRISAFRNFRLSTVRRALPSGRSFGSRSFRSWSRMGVDGFIRGVITTHHAFHSGFTRNPSPSTFNRLFLLPWKNK